MDVFNWKKLLRGKLNFRIQYLYGRAIYFPCANKAGSFNGHTTHKFLGGEFLSKPRVPSSAVAKIIHPNYRDFLAPERRLDAALYIESLIQKD